MGWQRYLELSQYLPKLREELAVKETANNSTLLLLAFAELCKSQQLAPHSPTGSSQHPSKQQALPLTQKKLLLSNFASATVRSARDSPAHRHHHLQHRHRARQQTNVLGSARIPLVAAPHRAVSFNPTVTGPLESHTSLCRGARRHPEVETPEKERPSETETATDSSSTCPPGLPEPLTERKGLCGRQTGSGPADTAPAAGGLAHQQAHPARLRITHSRSLASGEVGPHLLTGSARGGTQLQAARASQCRWRRDGVCPSKGMSGARTSENTEGRPREVRGLLFFLYMQCVFKSWGGCAGEEHKGSLRASEGGGKQQ